MFSLPPIPPWDALHPLVVHFPIALVMVAPVFVLLGVCARPHARVLFAGAALLMLLALGGAFLATATGDEAKELAKRTPGAAEVLHRHEELGETSRNFIIALAAASSIGAAAYWVRGARAKRPLVIGGVAVYLLAHAGGALVVANTAHEGGRLVHELGVRAWSGAAGPASPDAAPPAARDHDDD